MSEHYCGKKSDVYCVACDKERAVVEAALAWVKHGEILPGLTGSTISNLFDACAALRAFRERDGGR